MLSLILFAGIIFSLGAAGCSSSSAPAPREVVQPGSVEELFDTYFKFAANDDFEGMYLLMSQEFRNRNSFEKFRQVMEDDLKVSGGLKGGSNIRQIRDNGRYSSYQVMLEYNNSRMTPRKVVVDVVKFQNVYSFNNGMLMPLAAFNKF